MLSTIREIKSKVLQGEDLNFEDAMKLIRIDNTDIVSIGALLEGANEIRKNFIGDKADLCTILNARSGKCSEDCKYCAQSSHYPTGVDIYQLLSYDEILKNALSVQTKGINKFSLVTSGRGLNGYEFEDILHIIKKLKKDTNLKLCASLGIISYEQAIKLKESGLETYHHNIETSEENYENICTTHSYQERIDTIRNCRKAGLNICCGGIIGMNESFEDRIKMAFAIKNMNIKSVPINVLTPIKGTPFENMSILNPYEILKTTAVYRYILPDVYIRYAGGRIAIQDKQILGFRGGVNSAITGDYLTTSGSSVDEDKRMLELCGFDI